MMKRDRGGGAKERIALRTGTEMATPLMATTPRRRTQKEREMIDVHFLCLCFLFFCHNLFRLHAV